MGFSRVVAATLLLASSSYSAMAAVETDNTVNVDKPAVQQLSQPSTDSVDSKAALAATSGQLQPQSPQAQPSSLPLTDSSKAPIEPATDTSITLNTAAAGTPAVASATATVAADPVAVAPLNAAPQAPVQPELASPPLNNPNALSHLSIIGAMEEEPKAPPVTRETVLSILSEINSHDPLKIASLFAKDGFTFITEKGEALRSMSDIGAQYSNSPTSSDEAYMFKIESLQDQAPGVALVTGNFRIMLGDKNKGMGSFVANMKYDGTDWKLSTFQLTQTPQEEPNKDKSSGFGYFSLLLTFLIGGGAGFFGANNLAKRHQAN